MEAILESSELLVVLNVLDKSGRDVLEGRGGDLNEDGKEGMKKRFVGRLVVLLLVVFDFAAMVEFLLDTRRCSLAEIGITTVLADKPNLEKRGVTS